MQCHDWQQPLGVAEELLRRLSKPGDVYAIHNLALKPMRWLARY